HCVDPHGMQGVNLVLRPNSSSGNQLSCGGRTQRANDILRKAGQQSFSVHVGVEECVAPSVKCLDHLQRSYGGGALPSVDSHESADCIEGEYETARPDFRGQLLGRFSAQVAILKQCGPYDHPACT